MRVYKAIFFAALMSFGLVSVEAQIIDVEGDEEPQQRKGSSILDDSTKQIYGPNTTSFTYQENIKYNKLRYWPIDTSIVDLHKYQFISQKELLYTNLGNIGTPANSLAPEAPKITGLTSGFDIYDLYFRGPEDIKYYNSLSPYSRFKIIWGGQGRSITEVNFARNIDERSGFGFDYRGLFIDKQIQRAGRGDRNVRGTYYNLHGHYATRNGRYRILGNFIRNYQIVDEYGGILAEPGDPISVYFDDDNRQLSLNEAENNELRTNFHIYQQYKIDDLIQVYHEYDRYKQQNDFIDSEDDNPDYFDFLEIDSAEMKDRSKIVYQQHELGLKGDIGKTFYNFYYRYRDIDFNYKYLGTDSIPGLDDNVGESYGGVKLRFGNDSISYIEAFGEYQQGGNFRLGGSIKNSWLFANGITTQYAPAYVQQAYRGSHDYWVNDFDPSIMTKIEAGLNIPLGPFTIRPSVANTLLGNYIYFREINAAEGEQTVLPDQASSDINILSPSLGVNVNFLKHFYFSSTVIVNSVSGGSADAINLPDIYARGQLLYDRISFNGNLEWRFGFDVYWKSSYYARGYDPAAMQFYTQNSFLVESFPIIDAFADAKINRAKIFLKFNNVYEIFSDTGYFATPRYPGQTTIFDFGIEWAFYD